MKVAVFIRMMAGGSFWDLAIAFINIGMSNVHKIIAICLVAADNVLKLQDFPDANNIEGFKYIAIGFATSRKVVNPLPGCVAALYGICVAIEKPRRALNPLKYFCGKSFFCVPVQAVVDHCYRFVVVSIICAGATHDNLCLKISNIGQ